MNSYTVENTDEFIQSKVLEAIATALDLSVSMVSLDHVLMDDLGAEELDFLDIDFLLERAFLIRMPRHNLLQLCIKHFGEDAVVANGEIKKFGLNLLRETMQEIDSTLFRPGMRDTEFHGLITPQSYVRVVKRMLADKQITSRFCPVCSAVMKDSHVTPELLCPDCGQVVILRAGDEVLLEDLISIAQRMGHRGIDKNTASPDAS